MRPKAAKIGKARPVREVTRETPLHIRLTAEEKRMFSEAADRQHLTLSVWARLAMLHAAKSEHKLGR